MNRLARPHVWLFLSLILLAAAGVFSLAATASTQTDARDLQFFWSRHYWQLAFDSLSAVCGVGLLTYNFSSDYTDLGRLILTALGISGAALFLAAAAQTARRLPILRQVRAVPHPLLIVAAYLLLQALIIPLCWTAQRLAGQTAVSSAAWSPNSSAASSAGSIADSSAESSTGPSADWTATFWRATSAFSSLGWTFNSNTSSAATPATLAPINTIYTAVALLAALGWPLWLLAIPAMRRAVLLPRRILAILIGYVLYLAVSATLIFALESPRGRASGEGLSAAPPASRFFRSFLQTVSASSAGIPTESLAGPDVSDGTKLLLSIIQLAGPLDGSPGGGLKWSLLLWAIAGTAALIGFRPRRLQMSEPQAPARGVSTKPPPTSGDSTPSNASYSELQVPIPAPPHPEPTAPRSFSSAPHSEFQVPSSDVPPSSVPHSEFQVPSSAIPQLLSAATTYVVLTVALTTLTALGLLLLESAVGSRYQARPTFADAFLDASSAVAGGNLSSGLTATLTDKNLAAGMRQTPDQNPYGNLYQYGMLWLMLPMLLGRLLPLYVLSRAAALVSAAPCATAL